MPTQFTRPTVADSGYADSPRKADLVGSLVVVEMRDSNPAFETTYGPQFMAEFDLTVIDGSHAGFREQGRREFGNLGKQIAQLKPGQTGVGRIVTGQGSQGRAWFGFEFSTDDADYAAADAALTSGAVEPVASGMPF